MTNEKESIQWDSFTDCKKRLTGWPGGVGFQLLLLLFFLLKPFLMASLQCKGDRRVHWGAVREVPQGGAQGYLYIFKYLIILNNNNDVQVRRQLAYYDDTRIHACLYFISPTGHGWGTDGYKIWGTIRSRILAQSVLRCWIVDDYWTLSGLKN